MFQKGAVINNGSISILYLKNNLSLNRYVFCVSRFVKRAVDRNLIKRKIRSVIYTLKISEGFDIAVIANFNFLKLKYIQQVALLKELEYKIK